MCYEQPFKINLDLNILFQIFNSWLKLLTLISWTYCNVLPYLLYFWSKLDGFRKIAWIKVQIQFPKKQKQKNIVTWIIMGQSSWKLGLFIFYFNAFPSSALVSVHAEVNCPLQTSRTEYTVFLWARSGSVHFETVGDLEAEVMFMLQDL